MKTKTFTTVIDCNIIISAGISGGNCKEVIAEIIKYHQNYICLEILQEYKETINKPKLVNYKSKLLSLIKIICEISTITTIKDLKNTPKLPDKSDEIYLKTAIKNNCDFLVTGNLKDFPELQYHNTKIVSPKDFLKIIQCSQN